MSLEADLGIDSIKRVEILSAMKDRDSNLPDIDAMELAQLETLGAIIGALGGNANNETVIREAPTGAQKKKPSDEIADSIIGEVSPIFRQKVVLENDLSATRAPFFKKGGGKRDRLLIIGGERSLASAVEGQLTKLGYAAERKNIDDACTMNLDDVMGVLSLNALEEAATFDEGAALRSLKQNTLLAKNFAQSKNTEGRMRAFVCAMQLDGALGMSESAFALPKAIAGGLMGLVKTAAHEWKDTYTKGIDIDLNLGEKVAAEHLVREFVGGSAAVEVAINKEGRRTLNVIDADLLERGTDLFEKGDVVIATGGARGVTAICLEELCSRIGITLVLAGRTPIDVPDDPELSAIEDEVKLKGEIFARAKAAGTLLKPAELNKHAKGILGRAQIRQQIERFSQKGIIVHYMPCDVSSADDAKALVNKVRDSFGPIAGIVHGAGVLRDKFIADKSEDDIELVLGTKLRGLLSMLEATKDDALKGLMLFSSTAARYGNPGQVDYAMANEALNKVAHAFSKARPEVRVKSYGWGPWDGGMVDASLKKHFEERGVPVLHKVQGAHFFADEIFAANDVEVLFGAALTGEQSTDLHYSSKSHAHLRDHSVRGVPVLPAVFAIDALVGAAQQNANESVSVVEKVEVLHGVSLNAFDDGGNDYQAKAMPNGEGQHTQLKGQDGRIHYKAKVHTGRPIDERSLWSLDSTKAYDASLEKVYDERLFHGPAFHLIERIIGLTDNALVGVVKGVHAAGWTGEYNIDTAALDAALQMVLLFAREKRGGAFLPTSIEKLSFVQSGLFKGPIQCVVKERKLGDFDVLCDVELSQKGRVVILLEGVRAHKLPDENAFMNMNKERLPA